MDNYTVKFRRGETADKFMKKYIFVLIPIISLLLLTTYYVLITSNLVRYWADDFCSSVLLRNNGYFNSQIIWWKGWTGRYSYIAFLDFFEIFGLMGAKVLPVIMYVLILVSNLPFSLLSVLFLVTSPNIIQSFYWMTGSLNYFAPFVFLNFFLLLLFKKYKKNYPFIGFILLLVSTGFSEAFGVANILFLSFLFLICTNIESRKILKWGIFATIISLGFMYLAPGNAVRSAAVSHPSSLSELFKSTLTYSRWYLIHLLYIKTFVVSILTIIIGAFVFLKPKNKYFENPKTVILLSVSFMVAVTLAVVGLTYQSMNWEPPERVMSIVNNMIILGTIVFSVSLFQITNKLIPKIVSDVLFFALVLILAFSVNRDWSSVRNELKISAESPTYKTVGKLDGLEDNKGWVKSCIIEYYK